MYRVLIAVMRDWDSLTEMPALLSSGGCTVDVYCPRHFWILKNRFVTRWIEASASDEIFVRSLLEHIESHGDEYDWIIPADDVVIRHLNHTIESDELFRRVMPLLDPSLRKLLGSKIGLAVACAEHGIVSPKFVLGEDASSFQRIRKEIGAPFLIKEDESESGLGVHLCASAPEFHRITRRLAAKRFVAQQFIKGHDLNVEALYKSGKLIVYSSSETLKAVGSFGVSTQRLFHRHRHLEPELTKIGELFGLNGFANILFRRASADGCCYLIEVDMRPNAWMMYGRFAGSNFSAGVRKILRGDLTLLPPAGNSDHPTQIVLYYRDLQRCLLTRDFTGLMDWVLNRDGRWRYIPFYDLRAFLSVTRGLLRTVRDIVKDELAISSSRDRATLGTPSASIGPDHVLLPPVHRHRPRSL